MALYFTAGSFLYLHGLGILLRILLAGGTSPPCTVSHKAGGRKNATVFFLSMLIPLVAVVKLGELCNYVDSYLKCSKVCVRISCSKQV